MKSPHFKPKKFFTEKHKSSRNEGWHHVAIIKDDRGVQVFDNGVMVTKLSNIMRESSFGSTARLTDPVKAFGLFVENEAKEDTFEFTANMVTIDPEVMDEIENKELPHKIFTLPKDKGHVAARFEKEIWHSNFKPEFVEEVTNRATIENQLAAYKERLKKVIMSMKEPNFKTLSMWINTITKDDIIKDNNSDGDTGNRDRSNRRIANAKRKRRQKPKL